jgi:hypothetical protein
MKGRGQTEGGTRNSPISNTNKVEISLMWSSDTTAPASHQGKRARETREWEESDEGQNLERQANASEKQGDGGF